MRFPFLFIICFAFLACKTRQEQKPEKQLLNPLSELMNTEQHMIARLDFKIDSVSKTLDKKNSLIFDSLNNHFKQLDQDLDQLLNYSIIGARFSDQRIDSIYQTYQECYHFEQSLIQAKSGDSSSSYFNKSKVELREVFDFSAENGRRVLYLNDKIHLRLLLLRAAFDLVN